MDIFNKCVVVVPIQSKGEGDIPAGMIEALKIKENRNYYTQLARQIWKPRQFKNVHRTRGHRNFSDGARRTYIYIYNDMHNERVEADEKKGKGNIQWIDHNLELFFPNA